MGPAYDFHIHTVLCGHADERQQVPAIVARAEELWLEAITITEHIGQPEDMARIGQIRKELGALRPRCRVLVGGEVEADRFHVDGVAGATSANQPQSNCKYQIMNKE